MSGAHQETEEVHETEFGGPPLRKLHFSSGETLEMDDSEGEEEEERPSHRTPFREPKDKTRLSFKDVAIRLGRISLMVCDFLGERLAGALGLNAAKYQYAIDQYNWEHKRQAEARHHSPGLDGSRYGATGDVSSPPEPQERRDEKPTERREGRPNRGYQPDEDSWKSH
ncbi:protein FAM177A1 [Kryptolebias marmoratus]|uniref:Protein FAM177A1 n=1 Tax=Kryptolebias marmoratus TaxID=37003 RepID=A0A3Q3B8M3_KRYMA|nr:protein FAM177A1 [Kryptolebias marmoratus]